MTNSLPISREKLEAIAEAKSRGLEIPEPVQAELKQAKRQAQQPAGAGEAVAILREPHAEQRKFIDSNAKRKIVRAGRRGGKTVGVAIIAVKKFLECRRVLYATPTQEQIGRFWSEVKKALQPLIDSGELYKNETEHVIERKGTDNRIKAKTAWNADTLRGDYADDLILDEYQLMAEDAWEVVGQPMLLDNNGDAIFIYTPPSARSSGTSKARDKLHASKLFKKHKDDKSGRWECFTFSSTSNPHISKEALDEIANDMTRLTYEQEILAMDKDTVPGALWTPDLIEKSRIIEVPELTRIVTAVDPSVTGDITSDEAGIMTGGVGWCNCKGVSELHGFLLSDASMRGSPEAWARSAATDYSKLKSDRLIAEDNNGGEMVELTFKVVSPSIPVKRIHASRSKYARAEPVAALYEKFKIHHVGVFPELEGELTSWVPNSNSRSPNRLDALVWLFTELLVGYDGQIMLAVI